MSNQPLHLHHLQLFAISSVGQYALQKLIGHFAKKEKPNAVNEKEALSQIFTAEKDKVKRFANIFVNPIVTNTIYQDVNNNVFQPEIEIEKLDTNTCVEILRGIKDFATGNHPAGWTCNGPNHSAKCCLTCKHSCPQCGREECRGRCCVTKKKCSHKCSNCPVWANDCKENKYQCCKTCPCLGCVLKTPGLNSWHQLYKSLVNPSPLLHNVCPLLMLRLSVSVISIFRNITMHLTIPLCQDMDNGTFFDPNALAYCNSWKSIKDTVWLAVKTLLTYLKNCKHITELDYKEHSETLLSMCGASNQHEIAIFSNKIQNFLQIEHATNFNESLYRLKVKIDEIQTNVAENKQMSESIKTAIEEKILKIEASFTFKDNIDFHLACPEAQEIKTAFRNICRGYFDKETESFMTGFKPESLTRREAKSVLVNFKITSSRRSLKEYRDSDSLRSKALWNSLETILKNKFPQAQSRLYSWDYGSILIQVGLWKNDESNWSRLEIEEISLKMHQLEIDVEQLLPFAQCACQMSHQLDVCPGEMLELSLPNKFRINFAVFTKSTKIFDESFILDQYLLCFRDNDKMLLESKF